MARGASDDVRATELCAEVMRNAVVVADGVGALPGAAAHASSAELEGDDKVAAVSASIEQTVAQLEQAATTLRELQGVHRRTTLGSVADGAMSADEAMTRVDAVRRLDAIAHHASQSAAHLVDNSASARS